MSSAQASGSKLIPAKGKPKTQTAPAEKMSSLHPATFIIDPLPMMDLPQEVFDRYVLVLQVCNFNYSYCGFSGSLEQIDALERNITLCDVILTGLVLDKYGIDRFVRNKLIIPKTAKAWVDKLRDDSAAIAIAVAIKEFEDDIASGRLPAWIAGESWCGVGFDVGVELVQPVSPDCPLLGQSDGPTMDWAAEFAASESAPTKRPRSSSSSVAASETATVSDVSPKPTFAAKAAKPPKKKIAISEDANPQYSKTQLREFRNRRKARVQPLLKTAARAQACLRAQTSRMSAAKVGVSTDSVQDLINAYIGDDVVTLIKYSSALYKGVPCKLVIEKTSDDYYLEDIHCWRSFPRYVKTTSKALFDTWAQVC